MSELRTCGGQHKIAPLPQWLRAVCWMAVGALLACSAFWGGNAYRHHIIHGPMGNKHMQPNPVRIARLGSRVVPQLCAEIAEMWRPGQDTPSADLISWARALGEIGDPRAVPTLIGLADHNHESVRLYAVLAMWETGDPRCLPALKRLAEDTDEDVAWAACGAIEAVKETRSSEEER